MMVRTVLLGVALAAAVLSVGATDISRQPLSTSGSVAPNVVFGMDDSGSMDLEVMLPTNEGLFWWNTSSDTGWSSAGVPHFNSDGTASSTHEPFAYLFPVGCSSAASGGGARRLCDANGVYAVPPTPQFASLRSADYNPVYYNPKVTYKPWAPATIEGKETSFSAATESAAKSHPLFATPVLQLSADQSSETSNWTFRALAGMVLPAGAKVWTGTKWTTLSSAGTVGASSGIKSSAYDASVPYYPATYWVKETCTVDGTTCVRAPGPSTSPTLKRYEIKNNGTKFPSGRSYADELQNFANWFTYYRKRKLMLAASMGEVLVTNDLKGLRLGLTEFNSRSSSSITMYDSDSADAAANSKVIAGMFYGNLAKGGTPTRDTLKFIGDQIGVKASLASNSIVQASCQRNAAFLVTDGFANATKVTVPAYTAATYGGKAPYSTTHAGTLADLALSYYTNRLRTDLPAGKVPAASSSNPDPAADRNPNLHVNTYGITLGARGKLWPGAADPYKSAPTWVNPTADGMPESIDDLWHATINGRGQMFLATTPAETARQIEDALTAIRNEASAQSGFNFSTVNFQGTSTLAYLTGFNSTGWSGDVSAHVVDASTGGFTKEPKWSAGALLAARDWTDRTVFTSAAGASAAFSETNVGTLVMTGVTGLDKAAVVNYLLGDRSNEGTTLRSRTGVMGAIVTAGATVDAAKSVVYAPSGDGMVHAFDTATGAELWAYAPRFVLSGMGDQAKPAYKFQTKLDGTPVLAKVGAKNMLVGTAGRAGPGVYALDVTSPRLSGSETDIGAKVFAWEFPNASTSATDKSNFGTHPGRPVVVNTTKYGWVVLVTSGYNTSSDGLGRLFVLDAATGAVKKVLATTEGTTAAPAGLAAASAYLEADGKSRYAFAGDELGYMWRFDIEAGTVAKIATARSAKDAVQPLTTAPELGTVNGRRMVFFGTGRLLDEADMDAKGSQSFYAVVADGSPSTRESLAVLTASLSGSLRTVTGTTVNWSSHRGWVVDLPEGELATTEASLASGVLSFTTNKPSSSQCSSESALYVVNPGTGGKLPDSSFVGEAFFGKSLGSTLTGDVRLTRLVTGRLGVFTRQNDGKTGLEQLNTGTNAAARMRGWREVLR